MVHNVTRKALLLLCLTLCISKGICDEQNENVQSSYTEDQQLLSQTLFEEYSTQFNKVYLTDEEYTKRFKTWQDNDAIIKAHNSQNPPPTFTLGHNQFSDLTNEEYIQLNRLHHDEIKSVTDIFRMHSSNLPASDISRVLVSDTPTEKDWVSEGKVTSVKNQGDCGACWAFAAAATMESIKAIDDDDLYDLSVQELIDCDIYDYGCEGGSQNVFYAIYELGGLCKWEDYPYDGHKNDECKSCNAVDGTKVSEYGQVAADQSALKEAIASEPIWTGIVADSMSFQLYQSGVFTGDCGGTVPNHAVTAVGYGKDNATGLEYWLIKNSWGIEWGENGYIRLGRSSPLPFGTCSILADAWKVSSAYYYGIRGCMLSFVLVLGSITLLMWS